MPEWIFAIKSSIPYSILFVISLTTKGNILFAFPYKSIRLGLCLRDFAAFDKALNLSA